MFSTTTEATNLVHLSEKSAQIKVDIDTIGCFIVIKVEHNVSLGNIAAMQGDEGTKIVMSTRLKGKVYLKRSAQRRQRKKAIVSIFRLVVSVKAVENYLTFFFVTDEDEIFSA